jgi:hypothetical protein
MSPWRRPLSSSKGGSLLYKTRAEAEADDGVDSMPRCSCLPFCFWRGSRSRRAEAARGKRRRRFRLRLSWSWLRRRSGRKDAAGGDCTKAAAKQRRGRRLHLLLKTLLQAKKALASVAVSSDSRGLLPLPATVRCPALRLCVLNCWSPWPRAHDPLDRQQLLWRIPVRDRATTATKNDWSSSHSALVILGE